MRPDYKNNEGALKLNIKPVSQTLDKDRNSNFTKYMESRKKSKNSINYSKLKSKKFNSTTSHGLRNSTQAQGSPNEIKTPAILSTFVSPGNSPSHLHSTRPKTASLNFNFTKLIEERNQAKISSPNRLAKGDNFKFVKKNKVHSTLSPSQSLASKKMYSKNKLSNSPKNNFGSSSNFSHTDMTGDIELIKSFHSRSIKEELSISSEDSAIAIPLKKKVESPVLKKQPTFSPVTRNKILRGKDDRRKLK